MDSECVIGRKNYLTDMDALFQSDIEQVMRHTQKYLAETRICMFQEVRELDKKRSVNLVAKEACANLLTSPYELFWPSSW